MLARVTIQVAVGRNFDEILRVLDALQRDANYSVFTPANWHPGARTIVPYGMNDDEATKKFGKVTSPCIRQFKVILVSLDLKFCYCYVQNGYLIADLPSERGRDDIDKHYLRYRSYFD